jgi:TRAP-type mannitol/chloroaromatic compound transport system permease small subunit
VGGIVFLLPLCAFMIGSSWDYVSESWRMREISPEPGGIPAVFLLKSLIPLAAINLALQGVAEVLRNAVALVQDDAA